MSRLGFVILSSVLLVVVVKDVCTSVSLLTGAYYYYCAATSPSPSPETEEDACSAAISKLAARVSSLLLPHPPLFASLEVVRYALACVNWLWPITLLFLLPVAFVTFLYSTALVVQFYCLRDWLVDSIRGVQALGEAGGKRREELLRRLMAAMWEAHGRAFHGYEVVGAEKLPSNNGAAAAFLVYYHGTLPLDAYYFIARYSIQHNRTPIPVVDRFLFRLPGLQRILRLTNALEGSVDECVALLNPSLAATHSHHHHHDKDSSASSNTHAISNEPSHDHQQAEEEQNTSSSVTSAERGCDCGGGGEEGEILMLSPGGVREALFSDEYYSLLWGRRCGFARVAIRAKRPIYPVFTENIREGIRVVQYGKHWFRRIYEITRLPLCIFYGYFPVKLRTHIGDPIYPREGETAEQLADRAREAIEEMIARYQWRPSNLVVALLQRIPRFDAWVRARNERNYRARQRKDS